MIFIYTFAFFLVSGGILVLLRQTPIDVLNGVTMLLRQRRHPTLAQLRRSVVKPKPVKGVRRILQDCRATLATYNKSGQFAPLTLLSVFLFAFGALLGAGMENPFLAPVLAGGCALLPFLVVLGASINLKKGLNVELETATATITSSYLRSENLVSAVVENLDVLNAPVKEVFAKFLAKVRFIDPNVPCALLAMKDDINSGIFADWIDAMVRCQDDRSLKSTLMPIVAEFSDVRIVTGDLDNRMYEPLKDYISVAIMMIINIPFVGLLNAEWYRILMHTWPGQLMLAVSFVALFISLIAEIRLAQPVEYRR